MSNAPVSKNPPLCQGPDAQLRKPRHAIPAGAIDCHCHVFEDQKKYPLVAQRSYTPPLCTLNDYLRMSEMLGVTRMVQVNASTYGFDNTVTLDLIAKLGQKRTRLGQRARWRRHPARRGPCRRRRSRSHPCWLDRGARCAGIGRASACRFHC